MTPEECDKRIAELDAQMTAITAVYDRRIRLIKILIIINLSLFTISAVLKAFA